MYCRNCDKELTEKDCFCTKCGTHVERRIVEFFPEPKKPKKRKAILIITIVCAVVLVIAACLLIYNMKYMK